MVRRFVAGDRHGALQSMSGDTARQFRAGRKSYGSPEWWKRNFPIVYELVPISLEQVTPRAVEAKVMCDDTIGDYEMDPTEICDGCGEMRVYCDCDDLLPKGASDATG